MSIKCSDLQTTEIILPSNAYRRLVHNEKYFLKKSFSELFL